MGIFIYLILGSLAAFRLAELLIVDSGPFDSLARFRGWLYQEQVILPNKNRILSAISPTFQCVHCLGMWICVPLTLAYYIHNFYLDAFILYLAMCGLQSILSHNLGRVG
jgi:NADH:ubiquinone oxidoreductase subunit H